MKPLKLLRNASLSLKRSTYVKLLLSFIVLNILNVVVVFGLYYFQSDRIMKEEIDRLSHKLLAQTQNVSNYLYTSTIKGGLDLYYDDTIYAAMFSGDEMDVYNQFKLANRLNRFIQSNPIVHSIYLYNTQLDVVVSTAYSNKRIDQFPDTEMTGIVRDFHYRSPKIPFLLRHAMPSKPEGAPTLSLLLSEPSSRADYIEGAMIINIDDDQLQNMLSELSSDPINKLFILQDDGSFVTSAGMPSLANEKGKFKYQQAIAESSSPNGTFIENIDGEKYVLAYQRTNLESTGFTYVSLYPYTKLFGSLIRIRELTMIGSGMLIALSLLLSVLLSKRLYVPIQSLAQFAKKQLRGAPDTAKDGDLATISRVFANVIKDNESLGIASSRMRLLLRDQLLRSLLLGHKDSRIALNRWVKEHRLALGDAERVRVVLCRIDGYRAFENRYDQESRYLFRYAMRNIAEETFAGACRPIAVEIGEDQIAVLVDASSLSEDALIADVRQLQHNVGEYLKLGVTVGIGDTVEALSEADYSYESALSATHCRLFRGPGAVHVHDRLFGQTEEASYDREKAILDELRLGRPHKTKEAVDGLLLALDRHPCRDPYAVLARIVANVAKAMQAMPQKLAPRRALNEEELYAKLSQVETADDMSACVTEILVGFIEHKEEGKIAKAAGTIERGVQYIDANYSRVEFSVNDVAEHLRYSVSYLNKLFNDSIGFSVHEYINRKRLQRSKELIEKSDALINDIAAMAGFSSSNYFYFVFKKEFGMTPNAYRKQHGGAE
ncbi:helix-turn-helix domain-containing protein [Cohnella yongneupensis]|uniref:Helix-turn-helix domain-containing protein n=1 Tax=Cohnella yongneupensis TaxID=425006 RepID=A0ABW0R8K1_9BACL